MNIMNYILTVLVISMSVFVRSRPLNQDDITVSENDVEAHSILPEILSGVPEYLTNPKEPQYNTAYDTSIYNSIDTGVGNKYTHYQPAMSVHQPWSNRARSGHGYHYQPRPAPPHSLYPQLLPVPGHGGYPQPLPAVVRGQQHRQVHHGHGHGVYDVSNQIQHFQDFKIKKNVNSTHRLDKENVPSVNTDLVKYDYSAPYEHNNYHHELDYDHGHYDHHIQDMYGKNYDHGHYDHHIQDVYGKNYDHGHYDHHIQDVYERDYDHGHHDHHQQDMYGKTNNTEPIESQNWSFGSFLSSVWPFNYHGHGHGQNHRGLGGPGALPEIGLDAVQEVSKDHLLFTP